ncbi:hypothetical protein J7W19_32430 [Streptomyces mobaraensis NBRC 13819 = DSM 40847]|uniref:Serine/threonine protein kinase n=1 Tax=Streptomyces mobaraensis TaxID=35621 RepID=A0A5N5VYX5_STRMB|nr:hypothetical protein [Streptomyces mobaraensis]KAB7833456.1 hypothetical protein FRZ00_33795 [Streptomyces mobaraensis]QTT77458.1 hypothetical protein J7W19_32430 [Streptomyces mobaraensis NBRC 13819 = DSM 40847]
MGNLILQFAGWYAEDEPDRPATHERREIGEGDRALIRYDRRTDALSVLPADRRRGQPGSAAVVAGHPGHWSVTNLHAEDTYFVENMERGGEFVKVPPRRKDFPIPFELARLVLPVARRIGVVNVYGPEPSYLAAAAASDTASNWPRLDERSAYFRVLVALCEPQLRGYPPGAVPTTAEVIDRLRGGPRTPPMSRAAVNHHINYLATEKLQVTEWAGAADGKRSYWKREAVVAMALRSGLVDERHLGLLPQRLSCPQRPAPPRRPVRSPLPRR